MDALPWYSGTTATRMKENTMPSPLRERRRLLLRDEILQAAGGLLNEKGYAAMSMDELASRVGISKPTLYSHFAAKEDLIIAAVLHWFDRIEQAVQADATPRSPLDQLTFVLRTVVQMQIDDGALAPRPWAPEIFQVLGQRQEVLVRLQSIGASVNELVCAGIRCGEMRADLDPAVVVRAFFALSNTLNSPVAKLVGPLNACAPIEQTPLNPAHVADTLAIIFANGVRAG